ncbi:hypothetical protein KAU93_04170 [Candidatus Bathyarchaeota archaeon]|nr:hypothetical protein [Candidatus Bathyarchaeota archaeon]
MTSISRKIELFVPFLLSLILIATSAASLSGSAYVSSFGTIDYSGVTLVDFENDDCFKWGINGKDEYMLYGIHYYGSSPNWTRGGYGASQWPDLLLFENETLIVRRGFQSAKLSVVDTSFDGGRRIEILHDWNPDSEYIWEVAWYYFPSSLKPLDSWMAFHRMIYERMWDQDKAVYYQYFHISVSAMTDGRTATNGQQIFSLSLSKGNVDNNNDGVTEEWPHLGADLYSNYDSSNAVPSSWLTKKPGFQVPFDQWFKVTTLVFRNMTDFDNGYIKVWIDDELIWDVQGTRTVGIAPEVLKSIDPLPPDPQGFLSSGIGLYTGVGSSPKTIFVDDVIISNSSQLWFGS